MKNLLYFLFLFLLPASSNGQFFDAFFLNNIGGNPNPDRVLDATNYNRLGHGEPGTYGDPWSKWAAIGIPDLNFPPYQENYYGFFSNWSSDRAFFGLVNNGFNKSDALIAFGDNHDGAPDYNRLIFRFESFIPAFDREIATMRHNGNFGLNTANPTATLHLDAAFKPNDNSPSNVRLENLQNGNGNYLVIDSSGYVYDSHVPIKQGQSCKDTCHWRVDGNNILTDANNVKRNKFGTTSNDNVRVITNNIDRGVITNTGRWGMGTMSPNAKLHVKNDKWGLTQIDATGIHPVLRLYENVSVPGLPTIRLALATSNCEFTHGTIAGDGILQNISNRNSFIFGTGWDSDNNNGKERMRIDEKGEVGINMSQSSSSIYNPTALLHVACQGNNEDEFSDVRFEALEQFTEGNILIINEEGYVFDSTIPLNQFSAAKLEEQEEKNAMLQQQVNDLARKVEELLSIVAAKNESDLRNNKDEINLEIYPNPTSGRLTAKHYIPKGTQLPQLAVVNQSGQEILRLKIDGIGLCTTNLQLPDTLSNGIYYCSLFVNGKLVKTEKINFQR